MERRIQLYGLLTLLAVAFLGTWIYFVPPFGKTIERCAELHDARLGDFYVVAVYDQLGSVAFFHRDAAGEWLSFYLDHDALRWRNVSLRLDGNRIVVSHDGHAEAEYHCVDGTFTHHYQQISYSRQEGLEGGKRALAMFGFGIER